MPDDQKKLREEIEKACDGCDIDRLGSLTIEHQDTILAALRAVEALPISELEEAGMDLSKYTAAINWRPGDNTQEWLNGLHERISTIQAMYSARAAALASQPTPPAATCGDEGRTP